MTPKPLLSPLSKMFTVFLFLHFIPFLKLVFPGLVSAALGH